VDICHLHPDQEKTMNGQAYSLISVTLISAIIIVLGVAAAVYP
jgi:hypothetical protein